MENCMEFPFKIKNKTLIWTINSTWYISSGNKISILKRKLNLNIHCSDTHKAKTWKQPKCSSTDNWIFRRCFIHSHTEINTHTKKHAHTGALVSHKKKIILPLYITLWDDKCQICNFIKLGVFTNQRNYKHWKIFDVKLFKTTSIRCII
jgi:hypothetical protein